MKRNKKKYRAKSRIKVRKTETHNLKQSNSNSIWMVLPLSKLEFLVFGAMIENPINFLSSWRAQTHSKPITDIHQTRSAT